jgi:hypothetical protein
MENNPSIVEIKQLREEFEKFREEVKSFFAEVLNEANRKIEERPFGMLYLPSKGLFYKNKNKFLLVGYLTYFEENILTSEMMHEADIAMPIILEKVITNNNFDIKEILSCDVQAISMFLRAYAYGNSIEVDITCPHCERTDKHTLMISDFKSKDLNLEVDENGEISVITPKTNKNIKIKPKTFFEEIAFRKGPEKKQVEQMCFYITEFESSRDKEDIMQKLSALKILESREIKKAIHDNLPGIDTTITYNCSFCEKDTQINFGSNGADFLKLPASFMNNVLEEMFLLSHYGNNLTMDDIKKMPVGERRWMINRLSEELQKKKEAEEAEVRKAKSRAKSKRF